MELIVGFGGIALIVFSFFARDFFRIFDDRSVARQRRAWGSFEEWTILESKLKAGQGTIILNQTNLSGRVWWTPGAVESDQEGISLLMRQNGAIFTIPPFFMRLSEKSLRQRYSCAVTTIRGAVRM